MKTDLTKYGFRPGFDPDNTIVKQEYVTVDGAEYWVSTVDLGLNHAFGDGSPLYFETMIFPKGTYNDMYCNRYTAKEIALERHNHLVEAINNGKYEIVNGYFKRKDTETTESAYSEGRQPNKGDPMSQIAKDITYLNDKLFLENKRLRAQQEFDEDLIRDLGKRLKEADERIKQLERVNHELRGMLPESHPLSRSRTGSMAGALSTMPTQSVMQCPGFGD